jgi:hypothetical protein
VAKVIGPLHSTEARGRINALVYGTWRGVRYVRSFVEPQFKAPDCRIDQKIRVGNANAAWKLLSDADRATWHAYAQAHPRIDWTGVPIRISGYNAFVSCFTISTRAGGTPLTLAPSTPCPFPLIQLTCSQLDNSVWLGWFHPYTPTAHTYLVQILRTGPISLGRQPDHHHASIIGHYPIETYPIEDPLTLSGRYGYWGRVVDQDTGEISPPVRTQIDFSYVEYVPPTPEGPLNPGTVADLAGIGTIAWANPTRAETQDDQWATADLTSSNHQSHYLYAHNFGFSSDIHDDALILGIIVEIDRHVATGAVKDNLSPSLVNEDGVLIGTPKPTGVTWASSDTDTYILYGAADDLWGSAELTGAMIKSAGFGVAISAIHTGGITQQARVDHIRMTVYYSNP